MDAGRARLPDLREADFSTFSLVLTLFIAWPSSARNQSPNDGRPDRKYA
jgi:hypothetical protein